MKNLFALICLLAAPAFAADYNVGQCPVLPVCNFSAGQPPSGSYSDTITFDMGNWPGYDYSSSQYVLVKGAQGMTPCSGRGCHGQPYSVTVDSATLDGVPMTKIDAYHWKTTIDLTTGPHVLAITGTATNVFGREGASVQGIQYTPAPVPSDE